MNNLNRNKIKTKDILQSELERLYFTEGKTLDEIGHHYRFSDRQPIMRLFKKFGIKTRSKSENACKQSKPIPSIDEVSSMIANKSISAAAKQFGYTRQTMTRFVETYGLKHNYFVNKDIRDLIIDPKFNNSSPKEIALELDIEISVVKYYRKNFPKVIYNRDDIIIRLQKYGYDLDNQGLIKQIKFDDVNLYDSIIELTKNHKLQSKKLTERIYRIINKYDKNRVECCKHCGKTLIFYTYKLGYGNSEHKFCRNCLSKHCGFGVSTISQKLFDMIFESLTDQERNVCRYHNNGGEKVIYIDPNDRLLLNNHNKNLNKYKYHIDFIVDNKIIEFDGTYWHDNEDKDIAKDEFLKLKGYTVFHVKENDYYENSNVVLQKCINFLRQ